MMQSPMEWGRGCRACLNVARQPSPLVRWQLRSSLHEAAYLTDYPVRQPPFGYRAAKERLIRVTPPPPHTRTRVSLTHARTPDDRLDGELTEGAPSTRTEAPEVDG